MKVLIVGGTGLTGATTAKHLASVGYDVTLMSRSKTDNPLLTCFEFIQGNYIEDDISVNQLKGFDSLVFCAGGDQRMLPKGECEEDFFARANTVAIPYFFEKAKQAGIKKAAYVGSYYPQTVPEKIKTSPYVESRHLADESIRAMSDSEFCVCSLNAPFILGHFPGIRVPHLEALALYCAGKIDSLPLIAPGGGVNHITAQSMAEAIEGALERGECGKAYLVGDQNMTWKAYFELFCRLAGNPQTLGVSADQHPMLPDKILYAGRNATISYEPENAPLNYRVGNIEAAMQDVVNAYL